MKNRNQGLSVITVALALGGAILVGQSQAQGPGNKPFESTYRRPSVSPYNQLTQQGMNPLQNQTVYQTQVQPQIQQQQQQIEQLKQGRQMQQVQAQVANMNSPRTRQLDESIRPTGHASTYMNYSHYYPMGRR